MKKFIFKRLMLLLIVIIMGALIFSSCSKKNPNNGAGANGGFETTQHPVMGRIGLCFDNLDDENTKKYAEAIKKELEDNYYAVILSDAKSNQDTQDEQIDNCISESCNVFVIALCDLNNSAFIVDKSVQSSIPIIFIKNEPPQENLKVNPRDVFVGSNNKILNEKNDPKIILKTIEELMAGKSYSQEEQFIYTK